MSTSAQVASIETEKLNLWYGGFQALKDIDLSFVQGRITSLIGPSGCGKSTLLRCFNRMNERYGNVRTTGRIRILGDDILSPDVSLTQLRKHVGMVFQRPNPLPLTIRENVVFGLRLHGDPSDLTQSKLDQTVEESLRHVGLWDDVKDRLDRPAIALQLEQQQKLAIARLLPLKPEVILMDEPCSALDVAGTAAIEELMRSLAGEFTIVIVTHNMAQARRVSEDCAFMLLGRVAEFGPTRKIFESPDSEETRMYISGRYG
jgi:phosphate transport system ATP-binding protein